MSTDFSEEYKKWIINLSEPNFNQLIVNFAKEYYETPEVHICNGPYDGGLDLVYAIDDREQKRNIQITIQDKGYEKKLEEDLKKAKENCAKFSYQNKLDFYISKKISQSKKNKLVRNAEIKYNIDLKIYDAHKLGGIASEYSSIRNTIFKFNKIAFPPEKIKIDKNSKILFDSLTMSQNTTQLKNDYIDAFILFYFFENGESSVSSLVDGLKGTFYDKFPSSFYENEIGKLKQKKSIILVSNSRPKTYNLHQASRDRFEEINQNAQMQEAELLNDVKKVLQRYNIENETDGIVNLLVELYNSNYDADIQDAEHISNGQSLKTKKIFTNIINHIQTVSGLTEEKSNDIARNLLIICKKNDYLNKASVSNMFANMFQSDKLEYYLSKAKRKVYLDTQILLQCICNVYSNEEIDDQLHNAIRIFLSTIESANVPITLNTTIDYVTEVSAHIQNALRLECFLSLDYIKDLGKSKNVFFNYYLSLCKMGSEFEDFSAFIDDLLDIETPNFNNPEFIEIVSQVLVERFDLLDINVETPHTYDRGEYQKYKRDYEISLTYSEHDKKSFQARKNDLNAILHISDNQYDLEENEFIEPYFITWDTSFFEARKQLLKHSNLSYWYLMPPLRFANTISVIDFKVNCDALNYNILSMVEDNFNLSSQSISFIDLMNSFVDNNEVSKWKLGGLFAKMRKKLQTDMEVKDFKAIKHNNLPIDEFLLLIRNHYQNPSASYKFKDIIDLFHNNYYADKISKLIEANINNFSENRKLKTDIADTIDELVKKNKRA